MFPGVATATLPQFDTDPSYPKKQQHSRLPSISTNPKRSTHVSSTKLSGTFNVNILHVLIYGLASGDLFAIRYNGRSILRNDRTAGLHAFRRNHSVKTQSVPVYVSRTIPLGILSDLPRRNLNNLHSNQVCNLARKATETQMILISYVPMILNKDEPIMKFSMKTLKFKLEKQYMIMDAL